MGPGARADAKASGYRRCQPGSRPCPAGVAAASADRQPAQVPAWTLPRASFLLVPQSRRDGAMPSPCMKSAWHHEHWGPTSAQVSPRTRAHPLAPAIGFLPGTQPRGLYTCNVKGCPLPASPRPSRPGTSVTTSTKPSLAPHVGAPSIIEFSSLIQVFIRLSDLL